jgi:hypothetical protein
MLCMDGDVVPLWIGQKPGERTLFGPDLVKHAEAKVQVIRKNLKLVQIRQKSYHDRGTTPRQYEVGDYCWGSEKSEGVPEHRSSEH